MARNWKDEIFRLSAHANNCLASISLGENGLEPSALLAYLLSLMALERHLHPIFSKGENEELKRHERLMRMQVLWVRENFGDPWISQVVSNNFLFSKLFEEHDMINDFCDRHDLTPDLNIPGGD